ncbi:MAG: hypothetical protein IPP91_03440 [Betaproteobacteria bacterium]|nr:hypothetical protein [Betaproteobacteria bacterium]
MEKTIIARALAINAHEDLGISRAGADQANSDIRLLADWELVLAAGGEGSGDWMP